MIENWKPIQNFHGYDVSDRGNVRSHWRRSGSVVELDELYSKIMTPFIEPHGYASVMLRCGNKRVNQRIHQLVLIAFVGPRPHGFVACHNDGSKNNNCPSNLRWDTQANNLSDMKLHGTFLDGERHPNSKLTEKDVCKIRELLATESQRDIAKRFGVAFSLVSAIKRGKRWKCVPVQEALR